MQNTCAIVNHRTSGFTDQHSNHNVFSFLTPLNHFLDFCTLENNYKMLIGKYIDICVNCAIIHTWSNYFCICIKWGVENDKSHAHQAKKNHQFEMLKITTGWD